MCSHDDRYPTHILFRCKGGWGIERKCYRLSAPKINTRLTSILCAGITHHFRPPHPPPRTNDRISKILNRKLATPLDPKPRLLPISLRNSRSKERAHCVLFPGLWRHVSTRSLLSLSINYFLSFVVVAGKGTMLSYNIHTWAWSAYGFNE